MEKIIKSKAYQHLNTRLKKAIRMNDKNSENIILLYIEKLKTLEKYLDKKYPVIGTYYFEQYTDHGWEHTINVLNYMFDIVEHPDKLSNEEIMLIIFTALLHDIGMAQTKEEGEKLYTDEFIMSRVKKFKKDNGVADDVIASKIVRTELIRGKHGEISENVVKVLPKFTLDQGQKPFSDLFKLKQGTSDMNVVQLVSVLCRSHMESVDWIRGTEGVDHRFSFIAGLLRIADYLDMDSSRANEFYQSIHHVTGFSRMHYTINQIISSEIKMLCEYPCNSKCPNHKHGQCAKQSKQINLTVTYPPDLDCGEKPEIMCMVHNYKDDLSNEVIEVTKLLDGFDDSQYHIRLLPEIRLNTPQLVPNGVEMDTHKLTVDYSAIKTLFSSSQLYKSKLCGLRELMQNAYDACKGFSEQQDTEFWSPKIIITIDTETNSFSISDNGIGMTDMVIRNYFLNIGKSIYNFEPLYVYENFHKDHIGHFGLGFFAAFMISSKVTVETKHPNLKNAIKIDLDINSNYATLMNNSKRIEHGTTVTLILNEFQMSLSKEYEDNSVEDSGIFAQEVSQYIKDTFLESGIEVVVEVKHSSTESLALRPVKIEIDASKEQTILDISKSLVNIKSVVALTERSMPPIYFAIDSKKLELINYEKLLNRLQNSGVDVPYLDAGSFLIFSMDELIVADFKERAEHIAKRQRSLSGNTTKLSESINISIEQFYNDNHTYIVNRPYQCRYAILTYISDSRSNSALCEKDVPCSKYRIGMLLNDACGELPLCDQFYMRDVLLTDLHITLPYLNFRYSFNELIANVKTDNVYPTLPRDTLTDEYRMELGQAIGKVIAEMKNTNEDYAISEILYGGIFNNTFYKKG